MWKEETLLSYERNFCQLIPTTADSFETSFKGRNISDKNRATPHTFETLNKQDLELIFKGAFSG